ncbi:hypothetical protein MTO96_013334 [Rhipicephalus appendiculatus]
MSEPKISPSDPLKLWYSIKGDVRTAKSVALESLTLQSVDHSVYVMLQMNCDFIKKFEFLNISEIIVTNLRNGMSLMEISDCLRILAKYAKEMLKPTKERYKHWNKIPFMKAGAPQKWTRMDGTKTILKQLGYTQETSKGYIFPLHSFGPPLNVIKSLSLELALAAAELSVFYNNHHPHPEYIRNIMCPGGSLLPSASSTERREFNVMDLLAEVGNSANLRDLTQAPIPAQNLMSPSPHKGRGRPPAVTRASEVVANCAAACNCHAYYDSYNAQPQQPLGWPSPTPPFITSHFCELGHPERLEEHEKAGKCLAVVNMFARKDVGAPNGVGTAGPSARDGSHCDLCGCTRPAVRCDKCNRQVFCLSCDDMYHRHPRRKSHLRRAVDSVASGRPATVKPPPSAQQRVEGDPSHMPVPPPRKKKSLFSAFGRGSPASHPADDHERHPALPKKEFSWTDKFGSIKRFMASRPLPPRSTGGRRHATVAAIPSRSRSAQLR